MKPNIGHILVAIFMFMKILTFNVMSMMQAGRQQEVYGAIEDPKMCSLAFPLIRIDRSPVRHGSLRLCFVFACFCFSRAPPLRGCVLVGMFAADLTIQSCTSKV